MLRAALEDGYVESRVIDALSPSDVTTALRTLFDVQSADIAAHPAYDASLMTVEAIAAFQRATTGDIHGAASATKRPR